MRQWWSRIWLVLTLKCDRASLLQSDAFDRPLKMHERLALQGHFLVCRTCRALKRQLRFLDSANRVAASAKQPDHGTCELSSEASDRIQQRLAEEIAKDA